MATIVTKPNLLLKSFQGWREDGIWNLPDGTLHVTKTEPMRCNHAYPILRPAHTVPKYDTESKIELEWQPPANHHQTNERGPLHHPSNIRQRIDRHRLSRRRDTRMGLLVTRIISSKTPDTMAIVLVATRPAHALPVAIETSLSQSLEKMSIQEDWFPLFLRLPTELRLRIYFFALPRERLVEMIIEKEKDKLNYAMRSSTSIPALLQVSYESRSEALKFYSLKFGASVIYRKDKPRVYFDMDTDILLLNCHRSPTLSFLDLLFVFDKDGGNIADLQNVQTMSICTGIAKNLAFQYKYVRQSPISNCKTKVFLEGMPSLKRLICVSHGKTSLANAAILPSNPDAFPTMLEVGEIEKLEMAFGVKLEFGMAGTGDSEVRIMGPVSLLL